MMDKKTTNKQPPQEGAKEEMSKELRLKVATALAAARFGEEISQEELAQRVGTQKSSISRLESGRQNMTVDYIELLADAMNQKVSFVMEAPAIEYGAESDYELRLYDEVLMRFRLHRGDPLQVTILDINEERRDWLPLELSCTSEGLRTWLEHRVIPSNREFVEKILSSLQVEERDIKGVIDVGMGLSLNDSYWTPQQGFAGRFTDYNLYENRFDETLSFIAYVGYGSLQKRVRTTPELTTGGMLRKAWRYSKSKGIWLYKSGTFGFANTGFEPYSEYYASRIAQKMGLHAVIYKLENWHGILASKCRLFTDIDTSFIPIGRLVSRGGIDACIAYYKELGEAAYQELASMLVFDAVIINEDRHYGNFGVLRDNHTGKVVGPAPIFDNGVSLLTYASKGDFTRENIHTYVETRTNPYGPDNQFFDLAKKVMGAQQKKELRRLIGFRFEEGDAPSVLPAWRTQALEELIQERVQQLLAL